MNLLADEIYVKAALSYHGGSVFGAAQNSPENLAWTIFAIMVKCIFGGSTFVAKMIPVYRLTAEFQFKQVSLLNAQLGKCMNVISILWDGSRISQAFFTEFQCLASHGSPKKSISIFFMIICSY